MLPPHIVALRHAIRNAQRVRLSDWLSFAQSLPLMSSVPTIRLGRKAISAVLHGVHPRIHVSAASSQESRSDAGLQTAMLDHNEDNTGNLGCIFSRLAA
jgi:hypothetical protein